MIVFDVLNRGSILKEEWDHLRWSLHTSFNEKNLAKLNQFSRSIDSTAQRECTV